jgi:hypothetical protein
MTDTVFAKVATALDQFEEALSDLYLQDLREADEQAPSASTFDHDFGH